MIKHQLGLQAFTGIRAYNGRWLREARTIAAAAGICSAAGSKQSCMAEPTQDVHTVIALGSNLGDRAQNFSFALQQLSKHGVKILRHSALYETAPAYVTDQPAFLNAAVLASTALPPRELLRVLKQVEAQAGRDLLHGRRYGPRPLDLDIIFYGSGSYKDEQLEVPHPRWQERSFVKAPLADLILTKEQQQLAQDQGTGTSCSSGSSSSSSSASVMPWLLRAARQWAEERRQAPGQQASHTGRGYGPGPGAAAGPGSSGAPAEGDVMRCVMPIPGGRLWQWGERTRVMGILNTTPDSFSDGGRHQQLQQAVEAARRMAADGADIIDIGGQSTRPGATRLTAQEELARVMPVIRALRSEREMDRVILSIDTFYADVAREAVQAGVDIVNDVSAGALDPGMMRQVAELGVPYVLMHMRGDPQSMASAEHSSYRSGSVLGEVGQELQAAAERAMEAGIPAWNIILDPGIGFAKAGDANVELIRRLPELRSSALQGALRHAPLLLGPSRKAFLGRITGRKVPAERDAATVAACVAGVVNGADIVRVHNVRDVSDGIKVADAIFRQQ